MSLLSNLQPQRSAIKASNPMTQAVRHDQNTWAPVLAGSGGSTILASLRSLPGASGTSFTVTRQDLCGLVRAGAPLVSRFALTMIWGYAAGTTLGPSRVAGILGAPGLQPRLAAAATDIGAGRWKNAYGNLRKIGGGLGVSYLTKFLYFEARSQSQLQPGYPLIFDNRVSHALVKFALDANDSWVADVTNTQRGEGWRRYSNYLSQMHALAGQLHVDADELEYWLFLNA